MSITLDIPEDFARLFQTKRDAAENRLHLELAIALYQAGQMPVRLAAELAGRPVQDFEEVLRQRQVTMPYTLTDLEHDCAYARGDR
jgi:predicted HTH domain antitoxin